MTKDGTITTRKITDEEAQACASESIHVIGSIQPHGFQFVLDPETFTIVQHSENTIELINQYLKQRTPFPEAYPILHTSIFDWLALADNDVLTKLVHNQTNKIDLAEHSIISSSCWECVAHLAQGWPSLEFIPTSEEISSSVRLISQMHGLVDVMRSAETEQGLFETITRQFQQYTRFDRVMMYRFLPDWSGEVISEAVSDQEEIKFIGLRFPSADIPQQARDLYAKNKVRVFANVDAEPSRLTPAKLPNGQPLDQSYTLLRNMSDMHRMYLKNMGVKATLTLSILVKGKLWGLVVFHNNTPKTPPNHVVAELKLTCDLFSEILSSYLIPSIEMIDLTHLVAAKECIEHTFNEAKQQLITQSVFELSLKTIQQVLKYDYIGIVSGDYCYVLANGEFKELGEATISAINTLFDGVDEHHYKSHTLHAKHEPIPGLMEMVGIYVRRSTVPSDFCVFFGKNEVVKSIKWGGVPNTVNIVIKGGERKLEPRSSFALWREHVKGRSDHWESQVGQIMDSFFNCARDFVTVKSNELLLEQLEHSAYFDALTHLANRSFLKSYIDDLNFNPKNPGQKVSVLFIDLDNFKDVNDFMGHETGDRILQTVASRLKACSRPDDLVVRLGGDEFVIVVTHDANIDLISMAEKVVHSVGEPVFDHEYTVVITPSVGVISAFVKDLDFNELLKRADIAMYTAKNKGKNSYHIFDKKDQDAFNKKAILTLDLRKYVSSPEMELHFQPQFNFDKQLTGAEALARWDHPTFGYISPEVFIQVAEMNNLIKPLSMKIIATACKHFVTWRQHKLSAEFDTLSINISPSLLLDKSFEASLLNILNDYRVPPAKVRLEITESIFMQNHELAIAKLQSLRDRGFTISLDDFGTGFSSLNYLWKLPIDEIKIDKSFISNMTQDESLLTMVESIIDLCKKLNLEVVAEGVEDKAEFNILKGLGCDTCQGYYLSKPVPNQEFISQNITHDQST
ncbi:EAL domain-containing protein [Saccharophagus degradans]|uniref:bifunctional diguanylate cyclase/phosphodiesterase n=1 Tax=Saccharophagus degradans TaxID=86304 RepID=UPI001C07F2A2|nr:EAL domain-containing protein [Saccharophagus degradans]MBU2983734.1 EAL domain-containing protein [Saccharophagus degradans]